ncbi:MAG: DMT family transporter [Chloroflexi bacterium]|nr:DMT family transporter [Chloroflexota bacterium]
MLQRSRLLLVLLIGIFAVSTASILIRFARQAGVPALMVAAYRLSIATLVLSPIVLRRHLAELKRLTQRDWLAAFASGVFLALHFATWVSSLDYTTVTSSVVLVTTGPIWVALASWLFLREKLSRPIVVGLIVSVVGGVIVGLSDSAGFGLAGSQLWGDFLALAGAWFVAGYLLIGRQLRDRMSLIAYIFIVYGSAAVLLIALGLASGASFSADAAGVPYQAIGLVWLILMALFPQLLGHSSYNYALRFLPTTYVAVVALAEPVGTSILAFVLLNELPPPLTLLGAAVILIGIAVASWPDRT